MYTIISLLLLKVMSLETISIIVHEVKSYGLFNIGLELCMLHSSVFSVKRMVLFRRNDKFVSFQCLS